jgi:ASC-1-like (ASCH) protein
MSIHSMKLDRPYFEEVIAGRKTVEIRLNDQKRSEIKPDDQILFMMREDHSKQTLVSVVRLRAFPNLEELFSHYDLCVFGRVWSDTKEAIHSIDYYSPESISKYGILAIEIQLEA